MMQQKQTISYKVISLFIKAVILLLSIVYIFNKLVVANELNFLIEKLKTSKLSYVALVFVLMFVNWGLEAWKWQYLIKPLERISFTKSLQSVFSGVTVSIFMPNRIGEFAGRIFYLERADKIKATIKNFIGSISQLTVTMVFGLAAIAFAYYQNVLRLDEIELVKKNYWMLMLLVLFFNWLFFLYPNFMGLNFGTKANYVEALYDVDYKQWLYVFMLSMMRYIVFLMQFFILLMAFDIQVGFQTAVTVIALLFFVSSFIPSFATTEVITRGATAVYLFNLANIDTSFVIIVSLLLWAINLAIPALLGGLFVWKMKFFKEKK
ncbi:MAG: flippase-like domain-containing protein [Bacteroidetes bacterium]|nr:flippase-like domain-containing protein [Bacteroidota bacterium]